MHRTNKLWSGVSALLLLLAIISRPARSDAKTAVYETAPDFKPVPGAGLEVPAAVQLANGEIIYALTEGGVTRLARYTSAGQIETNYHSGSYWDFQFLKPLADGTLLIAAATTRGTNTSYLTRVRADGSVDESLVIPSEPMRQDFGILYSGYRVAAAEDAGGGRLYIASSLQDQTGAGISHFCRILPNGGIDQSFSRLFHNDPEGMRKIAVAPDGSVFLAGKVSFAPEPQGRLLRWAPDGSIDRSFDPKIRLNASTEPFSSGEVVDAALAGDGKIYIAGAFNYVGGELRPGFARLNANGILDASFNPGAFSGISQLLKLSDESVLAAGFLPAPRYRGVARYFPDGTFDGFFGPELVPGTTNSVWVSSMFELSGGDLLLTGQKLSPDALQSSFIRMNRTEVDQAFEFNIDRITVVETNSFIPIILSRGGPAQDAAAVTLQATYQSAAHRQVLIEPSSFTFAAGQLTQALRIAIVDDALTTPSETVRIVPTLDGGGTAASRDLEVMILEDDPGYTFRQPRVTVGEGPAMRIELPVTRPSSLPGNGYQVHYATRAVTASEGQDFIGTNGVLIFGATNQLATVVVEGINDGISEAPETFEVVLSEPSPGTSLGLTNFVATITIEDNEFGYLGTNILTFETNATIRVPVTRRGDFDFDSSIDFATADGTARAGEDYLAVAGTLHFAPGQQSALIEIPQLNDALTESNEFFEVRLSNPTAGVPIGFGTNVMVTIFDNDFGYAVQIPDEVAEGTDGVLRITRKSDYPESTELTVRFLELQRTNGFPAAMSGRDFPGLVTNLVFTAAEPTRTLAIPTIDDTRPERPEQFRVEITKAEGDPVGLEGGSYVVTITDDDPPEPLGFRTDLSFRPVPDPNARGIHSVETVDGDLVLGWQSYGPTGVTNRLTKTRLDGAIDPTFTPPEILELNFLKALSNGDLLVGGRIRSRTNELSLVRLRSNGRIDPSFAPAVPLLYVFSAVEDANGRIVFAAREPSYQPRLFRLHSNGSLDASFSPPMLSWVDNIFLGLQPDGRILVGLNGSLDNNTPYAPGLNRLESNGGLDPSFPRRQKGDNFALLGMQLSPEGGSYLLISTNFNGQRDLVRYDSNGRPDTAFRVNLPDSARFQVLSDGILSVSGSGLLTFIGHDGSTVPTTFRPGNYAEVREISPLSDGFLLLTGNFSGSPFSQAFLRGRLHEFDTLVRFNRSLDVMTEGKAATLELSRSGVVQDALNLPVRVFSANANGSVDYELSPQVISFAPGQTNAALQFTVADDTLSTPGRRYQFELESPENVATQPTILQVEENDPGFSLEGESYVAENAPAARFFVRRPTPAPISVSVDYFTLPGTADPALDFTPVTGRLEFGPADAMREIVVPLLNDGIREDQESFLLVLTNASAGVSYGPVPSVEVQIMDNELGYRFRPASQDYFLETSGQIEIEVLREGDFDVESTVEIEFDDFGADLIGRKLNIVTNQVHFAPGQTSGRYTIPLINDARSDGDVSFVLRMQTGTNAIPVQGDYQEKWLTIGDNEIGYRFTPAIGNWDGRFYEGRTNVIRVYRYGDFEGETTVRLRTLALPQPQPFGSPFENAVPGADFQVIDTNITFGAGQTVADVPFLLVNDLLPEKPENFIIELQSLTGEIAGETGTGTIISDDFYPLTLGDLELNPAPDQVLGVWPLPDRKILVRTLSNLLRYNSDGSLDPTFRLGLPPRNSSSAGGIGAVALAPDGTPFVFFRGGTNVIARLSETGVPIESTPAPIGNVQAMIPGETGDVYALGDSQFIHLTRDGTREQITADGFNNPQSLVRGAAGEIFVAYWRDWNSSFVAKYADGVLAPSFIAPSAAIRQMLIDSQGRLLLHLRHPDPANASRSLDELRRFTQDGAADSSFAPITFPSAERGFILGQNNVIYHVGYVSTEHLEVHRYLADGAEDPLFPARTIIADNSSVFLIERSPTEFFLFGGFSELNGKLRTGFANSIVGAPEAPVHLGLSDSVWETNGVAYVYLLRAPSSSALDLRYETLDGSARAGVDYVSQSGAIRFSPGQTELALPVTLIDNATLDPSRYFRLRIENTAAPDQVSLLDVILLNDELGFSISQAQQSSPSSWSIPITGSAVGTYDVIQTSTDLVNWTDYAGVWNNLDFETHQERAFFRIRRGD